MNIRVITFFTLMAGVLLLGSCSDNAAPASDTATGLPAADIAAAPPVTGSSDSAASAYAQFDTSATIRDVMNTLIDPNADAIWNGVRFEMDESGEHEVFPQTDEDWEVHRKQAIAMIEGANSLMIPGRLVAPAGATTEFPAYEFRPEEVDGKLREDWQSWVGFAQVFQSSVRDVIAAIEARDVDRFSEAAGLVDAACEACHSQYWYRTVAE